MTQSSHTAPGKVTKLSRAERNVWTKRKIFDAATKVVGKVGYAEASVARITEEAGVAQGTFYNHFENRQELLDQLLPKVGTDMVLFIRERTGTAQAARQEIERFSAFFDFIREVPEFLRLLNEAEYFAPVGYQKHLDNIATAYVRILRRARQAGAIVDYSDDEFDAIVHMLMGARGYLSRRYSYVGGNVTAAPEHVISAYRKLVTRGLFTPEIGNNHVRLGYRPRHRRQPRHRRRDRNASGRTRPKGRYCRYRAGAAGGNANDPVAGIIRRRERKRRRQRHRRHRESVRPNHGAGQRRRRLRQDAPNRARANGSMGPRGQYRSARHVSGRP
jgi:AcrR family transcriptional regulator